MIVGPNSFFKWARKWKFSVGENWVFVTPLICCAIFCFSFISHKEFRFIMPILPFAMCLVGKYLASIGRWILAIFLFQIVLLLKIFLQIFIWLKIIWKFRFSVILFSRARLFYAFLIVTNVPTMLYFGLVHQKAPLDCSSHLAKIIKPSSSVLFLMPCHSVPLFR